MAFLELEARVPQPGCAAGPEGRVCSHPGAQTGLF